MIKVLAMGHIQKMVGVVEGYEYGGNLLHIPGDLHGMSDGPAQAHIVLLGVSLHVDEDEYRIIFFLKLLYLADHYRFQLGLQADALLENQIVIALVHVHIESGLLQLVLHNILYGIGGGSSWRWAGC